MKQTRIQKHYSNIVAEDLLLIYDCQNAMQLPEIKKGIVSISSKSSLLSKQELINNFATCLLISGQRGAPTRARKSISAFQLRKGNMMGCMVTMRKDKVYALLDKVVSFVLPYLQNQPSKHKIDLSKPTQPSFKETDRKIFSKKNKGSAKIVSFLGAYPENCDAHAARVQSPSNWFCGEEQRDISFGVKEPTFFPEIESLSGAGALVQTNKAFFALRSLRNQATQPVSSGISTYKQTFGVLQGLNILLSFCTHKSYKKTRTEMSNQISRVQDLQTQLGLVPVKHTIAEKLNSIYTQDKSNHMLFLSKQRKTTDATTEKQKDLLFLSAFQYPARC